MRRLHILAAAIVLTLALAGAVWAATSDSAPAAPATDAAEGVAAAAPQPGDPVAAAPADAPMVAGQAAAGCACCPAAEAGTAAPCPMALAPQGFTFVGSEQAETAAALSKLIEELKASGELSEAGAEKLSAALKDLQASVQVFGEFMPGMPAPAMVEGGPHVMLWRSGEATPEALAPGEGQFFEYKLGEGPLAFSTGKLSPEQLEKLKAEAGAWEGRAGEWQAQGLALEGLAPHAFAFAVPGKELTDEQKAQIEKEVAGTLKGLRLEGADGDVLKSLGQGATSLDAEQLAQLESELAQTLGGLNVEGLELKGLAQAMPSLNLSADQLAQLESELSKLMEETLPQIEERLREVEKELAEVSAAKDKDA